MPARKQKSTSPRRSPKTELATATVDAILIAVEQLLEYEGPDRLSTNRVAEVAGVSIGSLYQYFPNKESLVGALQDKYAEDTLSRIRAALADSEALPIETVIMRVGAAILTAKESQRPIHRWLIDWRPVSNSGGRYQRRLDDEVHLVADYLRERTDIQLDEPAIAAFVLVHAIEGVIEAVSERPDENDAARIATCAASMISAFLQTRRT